MANPEIAAHNERRMQNDRAYLEQQRIMAPTKLRFNGKLLVRRSSKCSPKKTRIVKRIAGLKTDLVVGWDELYT